MLLTFLTEFAVLAAGILVYKLAAGRLGVDGFSEYAVSRRTVSLIQPAVVVGLGVGIPRYVALASAGARPKSVDAYFAAGAAILVVAVVVLFAGMNLLENVCSSLFFGSPRYRHLVFPISAMVAGLTLHTACYGYYRGKLSMVRANGLQALNRGVVLLLAFAFGTTANQVLLATGIGLSGVSVVFLFLILRRMEWDVPEILICGRDLIHYGVQRVPGDFGMAALLALPVVFVAHLSGLREAGHVAFGISLLSMAGGFFAPIGLILLPKATRLLTERNFPLFRNYVMKIQWVTFAVSLAGVLFYEVFADGIIRIYLGQPFDGLVGVTRVIMGGGIAYAIYVALRSIVDAYHVKAVNTINILLSLCVFLGTSLGGYALSGTGTFVLPGFLMALFLLGALTFREVAGIVKLAEGP